MSPNPAHTRPRRALAPVLLAALLLGACASTPPVPPKPFVPEKLQPENRSAAFEEVAKLIREEYVDPRLNGVDWAEITTRYRGKALNAADDEAYWKELNRMVGELRDAHSRVVSPMEAKATRDQRGTHGLRVQPHQGRYLVMGVNGNSQAALLGLRPGSELLAVDGQPAAEWWAQQAAEVRGSSTERSKQGLINQALNAGAVGSTRVLRVRSAEGKEREFTLRQDVLQHLLVRSHQLADGTGYLRFAGFQPAVAGELGLALRRLSATDRLVLDLRGNPGGQLKMTLQLLGWLLPPGQAGKVVTRDNKRLTALAGLLDVTPTLEITAQPLRLEQALAVLVDEGSASGAELAAAVLQSRGRARVFGSTSCGCLLAVRKGRDLPGGGQLMFSEVDMLIDGSKRIEGVGVMPDEPVFADPVAMVQGRDAVLDAARAWLAQQPAKPTAQPTPAPV
jgi:carboxyl-terminal processing protease